MPRPSDDNQGEHFEEAIAHHQLEVQTELKRASSLPSAMFDADDPMLEAHLCEATERIFRRLLELERQDRPGEAEPVDGRRLESVAAAEVAALLRAAATDGFAAALPLPLDDGAGPEFGAVLADLCVRGGPAAPRAARLLREQADDDLNGLMRGLAGQVATAAAQGLEPAGLEAVCDRIARAVLAEVYGRQAAPDQEREPS